ncbi:MAG: hypothetical protein OXU31_04070 [Gammaproteobacteria bacterium]|nr:hypothetical protein [Gammaproteobacteria bacterium]
MSESRLEMVELILGTVTAMLEVVGGALELTVTEAEISFSDEKRCQCRTIKKTPPATDS